METVTDQPPRRRRRSVGRVTDPVDRTIWALAIPALGALAIEPLYATADTIIVGRLGTTELAGLAVAVQIIVVLTGVANFLAYATTQRVALHRGAAGDGGTGAGSSGAGSSGSGSSGAAATTAAQSLSLSVVLGVLAAVLIALAGRPVARLLGASGEVLDVAAEYLTIRAWGLPAVLWALAAVGILRGVRDMVSPLRIIAAATVLNVLIELVMVFGLGWGVAGAALSTVVVQWLVVIAYAVVVRRHLVGAVWRPVPAEVRALLTAGGWLVLRVSALIAVVTIATAMAARLGEAALAAHQIVSTIYLVVALCLDALAIPAQTLIAESTGADDRAGTRHIGARIRRAAAWAGVAAALVVLALAPVAPLAFSADPAVRSAATGALVALAVLLVPGALAFAYDGILIGAGRYRALGGAMAASLVLFVVLVVVGWPLADEVGLAGIWGALAAWMLVRAWITGRIWVRVSA